MSQALEPLYPADPPLRRKLALALPQDCREGGKGAQDNCQHQHGERTWSSRTGLGGGLTLCMPERPPKKMTHPQKSKIQAIHEKAETAKESPLAIVSELQRDLALLALGRCRQGFFKPWIP